MASSFTRQESPIRTNYLHPGPLPCDRWGTGGGHHHLHPFHPGPGLVGVVWEALPSFDR